ncbi:MAG: hypothetical protein KIT83_16345 [Bryobacterales bacterium]|nr:hypothetical protein [Bryobacterales bacterium]
MRMMLLIAGIVACSLIMPAQGNSKGKGKSSGPQGRDHAAPVSVVFQEADQRILRGWVRDRQPSQLPPGLAKRGDLPPGLQKQLMRNGSLPPGLQKRISPFPRDLRRQMSPLPPNCGCERVFFDGRAMIVATATNTILDLMNLY